MTANWPFEDPPHTACITTRFVLDGSRPVLLVTHDQDDNCWQFLCGTTDDAAHGRAVELDNALDVCPEIAELADLPPGWSAWRDAPGDAWERFAGDE